MYCIILKISENYFFQFEVQIVKAFQRLMQSRCQTCTSFSFIIDCKPFSNNISGHSTSLDSILVARVYPLPDLFEPIRLWPHWDCSQAVLHLLHAQRKGWVCCGLVRPGKQNQQENQQGRWHPTPGLHGLKWSWEGSWSYGHVQDKRCRIPRAGSLAKEHSKTEWTQTIYIT